MSAGKQPPDRQRGLPCLLTLPGGRVGRAVAVHVGAVLAVEAEHDEDHDPPDQRNRPTSSHRPERPVSCRRRTDTARSGSAQLRA